MAEVPLGRLAEMRAQEVLREQAEQRKQRSGADDGERPRKKSRSGAGPAVLSTKVPVSRKRVVVHEPEARRARDPRFNALSGAVDVGLLQRAYGFVDESRARDLGQLEEELRATADPDARESVVERMRLLREQQLVVQQRHEAHELRVRVKAKRRDMAKEAGRPVKLSRRQQKDLEASERFAMLQEQGGVDRYIKGKRKKLREENKKRIPRSSK